MTGLKWTRKTTAKIARELQENGISVGLRTVSRLLKVMGYSLRVNHKKLSRVCKIAPEVRHAQFEHIAKLRMDSAARGVPVISVDTKKKRSGLGSSRIQGLHGTGIPLRSTTMIFPHRPSVKQCPMVSTTSRPTSEPCSSATLKIPLSSPWSLSRDGGSPRVSIATQGPNSSWFSLTAAVSTDQRIAPESTTYTTSSSSATGSA